MTTVDAFATGLYRPHAIRLALATVPRDELGGVLRHLRAQIETIPP